MKLGILDHHASGHCQKDFQGQRSKIKVVARPDALALLRRRLTFRRWGVEAFRSFPDCFVSFCCILHSVTCHSYHAM